MKNWKRALIFGSLGASAFLLVTGRKPAAGVLAGVGLAALATEYPEHMQRLVGARSRVRRPGQPGAEPGRHVPGATGRAPRAARKLALRRLTCVREKLSTEAKRHKASRNKPQELVPHTSVAKSRRVLGSPDRPLGSFDQLTSALSPLPRFPPGNFLLEAKDSRELDWIGLKVKPSLNVRGRG